MPTSPICFANALRRRLWWWGALLACAWPALAAYDAARVLEVAAARNPRLAEQAQALVSQIERDSALDELQRLKDINDFFSNLFDHIVRQTIADGETKICCCSGSQDDVAHGLSQADQGQATQVDSVHVSVAVHLRFVTCSSCF